MSVCPPSGVQIYGKTSRRQAVEKLRAETLNGVHTSLDQPQEHGCALRDVMVNQAVKIHGQLVVGSLQSSRRNIAPDCHNASLVRLDVEEVRGTNRTRVMLRSIMGQYSYYI